MPRNKHFKTDQVAVTDSLAVLFDTAIDESLEFYGLVKNIGTDDVYIGAENVTDDCGYQLGADEELPIRFFDHNDSLSAICASGKSTNVCWLLAAYA